MSPRPNCHLTKSQEKVLTRRSVTVVRETTPLSASLPPQSNKIFATAWAEKNLREDFILFCDSDSCFLNEPGRLLAPSAPLLVSPAWAPGIASLGTEDPADQIWQMLAESLGITLHPVSMFAAISGHQMRPYFNTGFIFARRDRGLYQMWLSVAEFLSAKMELLRPLRWAGTSNRAFDPWVFFDQLTFALAIQKIGGDYQLLEPVYNAPIHYRTEIGHSLTDIAHFIHVHYLYYFRDPQFLGYFSPPLDRTTQQYAFIEERLPLSNPISVDWPPTFIDDFIREMMIWRLSLFKV